MNFITVIEKNFKRTINLKQITCFVCESGTTKICLADKTTVYIKGDITSELRKAITANGGTNPTIEVKE